MNTSTDFGTATDKRVGYFEYLPAGLFGSVMGLTGLSLVWGDLHARYGAPAWIATLLAVVSMVDFAVICVAYAVKIATSPAAARDEFRHPIAVNMFATFWVSLLLLPLVIVPFSLVLAQALWTVGAAGMMVFAVYIVSRWLSAQHQMAQATPAWILPVVGLIDLPLAVPYLSLPQAESFMLVGTAVGFFFAIPLFTIIFSRLIFEPPMPPSLQPTLMILVAPFAVGTSTYVATTGGMDLFGRSLYVLTIFMLVVLLGRLRHLPQCCPFRFAWWAVSFPLAASAIAALKFAKLEPGLVTDGLALFLAVLSTAVILWLLARTVLGVLRGELRTLGT